MQQIELKKSHIVCKKAGKVCNYMKNNKVSKQPELSIVVPVFNVEKWIDRCLRSILVQSFSNYELIIVNDGSTDSSLKICENYSKNDSRIVLLSKKNGGLSDARNYGLRYAKGDYVVFIDSDDFIEKNYLEKLLTTIKSDNSDIAICGFYLTDSMGNKLSEWSASKQLNFSVDKKIIKGRDLLYYLYQESGWVNVPAWNKIYKRTLLGNTPFKKGIFFEDSALIHHLVWNRDRISVIHQPLYNYVQRDNSILNSPVNLKKIKDRDFYSVDRIKFFRIKDSELYRLSVNAYRKWIIGLIADHDDLLSNTRLIQYFTRQFRKYRKVPAFDNKEQVKQLVGCVSITLLIKIIGLKRLFKK